MVNRPEYAEAEVLPGSTVYYPVTVTNTHPLEAHRVSLTVTDDAGAIDTDSLLAEVRPGSRGTIRLQEGFDGYTGASINQILGGDNVDIVYLNVPWATKIGEYDGISRLIVRVRLVRTLLERPVEPGRHQVHWDGRDDLGLQVPSGVCLPLPDRRRLVSFVTKDGPRQMIDPHSLDRCLAISRRSRIFHEGNNLLRANPNGLFDMETYRRVKVICYSGARGEETPRAIVDSGRRFDVESVVDRRLEEDRTTGERRRCFVLKLRGEPRTVRVFRLGDGGWFRVEPSSGSS